MRGRDGGTPGPTVSDRRESDDGGWQYVPETVLAFFVLSTLFTVIGARPVRFHGSGLGVTVLNVVSAHVLSMFMHASLTHYAGNMLGLVLFGGALTVISSDLHVLGVALVAHVGGSVLNWLVMDAYGIGLSLAVAGLVAATAIRTVAVLAGKTDVGLVTRVLGGAVALAVLVLFAYTSLTGTFYLRIADHHFGGWLFGALAELLWLGRPTVRSGTRRGRG